MAKLAIKGHPSRSKEIIEILEMLGGKNTHDYICNMPDFAYSINEQGIIEWFMSRLNSPYTIFTLEEFLEKYPYKVGDRVKTIYRKIGIVSKLIWSDRNNCIRYELKATDGFYFINELQPYKEETMDKANKSVFDANVQCYDIMNHLIKEETIWDLPDGYEFQDAEGNVIKSGVIRLVKKQSQYPKTYKECCDVLNIPNDERYIDIDVPLDYNKLLSAFTELIICRKAYWKIAGEEMGLDKPWEPDWNNDDETKFCIYTTQNIISLDLFGVDNRFLAFPTEEMRDAFYKNFKDLIEVCKKLL